MRRVDSDHGHAHAGLGPDDSERGLAPLSVEQPPALARASSAAEQPWPTYLRSSCSEVFFGTRLNILLLCTPLAVASDWLRWDGTITFVAALLALCPLAERLGYVTEQLALHTSATIGGLLNATFGNATEMIVSLFAIKSGLLRIVQLSLLGSVMSNLLLVLGTAFFLGGLRHDVQTFSADSVKASISLLMLGMITLLMPALLDQTNTKLNDTDSLTLSRICSIILLVVYLAFLVFQLKTHTYLFDGAREAPARARSLDAAETSSLRDNESVRSSVVLSRVLSAEPRASYANGGIGSGDGAEEEQDEEEEEDILGYRGSLAWLTAITLVISVLSHYIVDTIEVASEKLDIPVAFVSTILLPIVGNAAEHASAVLFAMKNKMDLSIGVAIGSSTQITLLAIPFCVVCAWAVGEPLSLDFAPFETGVFVFSILGASSVVSDGRSHWLKGVVLVAAYLVLAAAFWFHVDPPGVGESPGHHTHRHSHKPTV